jgi:biotin carboxylase
MVEEYLAGDEYSVETLDHEVVGVTRKHLGPEPYFLEIGHDFPASLGAADTARIADAARSALRALGLGWGPAHVELRCGPAGPRIIEVNPRLAGGMIPRMVEAAHGIDMVFHAVARAVGDTSAPRPIRTDAASIRFLVAPRSGRIARIGGVQQARDVPGVVEVELLRKPGDQVDLRHSFTDRLGYVIAAGPSADVAAAAANRGAQLLAAHIDATPVVMEAPPR